MKKYLGWLVFTLLIILVVFVYMKYFFTYSEGSRSGLLQKFSKKGIMFKTYEGEMILSSVRSSADMAISSEKFLFSVPSAEVAKTIDQIQGEYITVFYHEKKGALPWVGDTRYLVDSVKVSERNPYRPAAPY
jgi:hypothetical protein